MKKKFFYNKPKISAKKIKNKLYLDNDRLLDSFDLIESSNNNILAQSCSSCGSCGCAACGSCRSCPPCSDMRFKREIQPLTNVINKLSKIRGVYFKWNKTYRNINKTANKTRQIGLIAQEVEKFFPELVARVGIKNYRGIYYDKLTAVLIEAIKELKSMNDLLVKRIEALESG